MNAWLGSSLKRYYPASATEQRATLTLDAVRGGQVSAQAVFRSGEERVEVAGAVDAPAGIEVQVRRVGYVPMPHLNTNVPLDDVEGAAHLPGYVPDPLLPETAIVAGPQETHAFWITVRVPREAAPGEYVVPVRLAAGEDRAELAVRVRVYEAVLPVRRDFPVTHWFYADALLDWYKLQPFEEAFWRILDSYFANAVAHGQDVIYVPALTPPLDGVKRPTQLLGVRRRGERYEFDWSLVRRWIKAGQSQGFQYFEWVHLFTQWGAKHAIRVYEERGEGERLLWPPETEATAPVYRSFLGQYLGELHGFLTAEGLLDRSFFHLSDEPHGEEHLRQYRAAREMLRELAPWLKVMDALSEITFARTGLTDVPVPVIDQAPAFVREGFPAWAYYCCGQRGRLLNRFLDTPLVKVRMSGWIFYRTRVRGFLQWGYNYWYQRQTRELIDPFTVTDAAAWPGWAYGDPFVVYPGAQGPIDSLRWEVFAESLQDYALLQAAGIAPDDPLLGEIEDFCKFPRNEQWLTERRGEVLRQIGRPGWHRKRF